MPSYQTVKHVQELVSIARQMEREAVTRADWLAMIRLAAEYEALADYMQTMNAGQRRPRHVEHVRPSRDRACLLSALRVARPTVRRDCEADTTRFTFPLPLVTPDRGRWTGEARQTCD